jgi:hypothetical protein
MRWELICTNRGSADDKLPGPLGTPITSLASSIAGNMFATGFEQAHSVAAVSVWYANCADRALLRTCKTKNGYRDIRKSKVPVVHYAEVHNDDVTEVSAYIVL